MSSEIARLTDELEAAKVRIAYLATNIAVLAEVHEASARRKHGREAQNDAEIAQILRGAVEWTDPMIAKALKQSEVNGNLIIACEAALKVLPGLEVRSWPRGHGLKADALKKVSFALASARGSR